LHPRLPRVKEDGIFGFPTLKSKGWSNIYQENPLMPHRSRPCAVIIDCPVERIEQSVQFWSEALGRPSLAKENPDEPYTGLETPDGSTIDIFVQAIGSQESRLHFDIETDDLEAEVSRLEKLGAQRVQLIQNYLWTMEAPSGHIFCVVPVQSKHWPAETTEWLD
jgi:hypothetical protein